MTRILLLFAALLLLPVPSRARPQGPDRSALALGTAGILSALWLDEAARGRLRGGDHPTPDDLALVARGLGSPELYGGTTAILVAVALAERSPAARGRALRVGGTLAMTAVLARGGKYLAGRSRPSRREGASHFEPFSDRTSLPSGHTAMAFALAGALSHEIDRPWATRLLYSGATVTAWSRLHDDVHWLSDVLLGAALGRGVVEWAYGFGGDRSPPGDGSLQLGLAPRDGGAMLVLGRAF